MAQPSRSDLLEAAFLESDWSLTWEDAEGGEHALPLRPVTLGSLLIARRIGLEILLTGGDLTPAVIEDLDRQLALFVWVHSAALPDVLRGVRNGTWRDAFAGVVFSQTGEAASLLIDEIRRVNQLLAESLVDVLPRPQSSHAERDPSNVIDPSWIATRVFVIASQMHWSEEYILWHLPIARAFQYHHCALRSVSAWTIKPGPGLASKLATLEAKAEHVALVDDDDDDDL